jgi:hypothetical protein
MASAFPFEPPLRHGACKLVLRVMEPDYGRDTIAQDKARKSAESRAKRQAVGSWDPRSVGAGRAVTLPCPAFRGIAVL